MNKIVAREALPAYPLFDRPFEIHTDASDVHLGSVIIQNGRPLAFYSRKLKSAQKSYTTREKEILSIVETLKEFKNILFRHEITAWTDHKKLTHEMLLMSSESVMRWRLLLEEYNPTLKYTKGEKTKMADCISIVSTDNDCPMELSEVLMKRY